VKPAALLKFLRCSVVAEEILENRQNILPVADNALQQRAKLRLAHRLAIPLGQDSRRNSDIAPELIGRMSAKEETVEKGRLALRELEFLQGFVERIGQCRHNRKVQFTDFVGSVKSTGRVSENK
jgi:hypothetical protein